MIKLMIKPLIMVAAVIGLSGCYASAGLGHSHAGFRVGDNDRPPVATDAVQSVLAQAAIAQPVQVSD